MKHLTAAVAIALLSLLPCALGAQQPEAQVKAAPVDALDVTARATIEAQVLEVAQKVLASREDVDALVALSSKQDGLCLFQTSLTRCSALEPMLRKLVSKDNPNRVVRQEVQGEDVKAMAVTSNVAVVGVTVRETRSYRETGEMSRATFTHLMVFVLEDGAWRLHSATQSRWPIAPMTTAMWESETNRAPGPSSGPGA